MVQIERLLKIVKKNRILYDVQHEDYKNSRKKEQLWNEIGLVLEENGELLKKKWKNLKDTYTKYLRATKNRSDQSTVKKFRKWQWAKQMEGFKSFIVFERPQPKIKYINTKQKNINECISHNDTEDFLGQSPPHDIKYEVIDEINCESYQVTELTAPTEPIASAIPTPLNVSRVSTKANLLKKQEDNDTQVSLVLQYLNEKRKERKMLNSPIDLIFSGYAQTVKTFSPQMQVSAKLKIAEVMSKLELQNQYLLQRNNCSRNEAQPLSCNHHFDTLNNMPVPVVTPRLDNTAIVDEMFVDDRRMEPSDLLDVQQKIKQEAEE